MGNSELIEQVKSIIALHEELEEKPLTDKRVAQQAKLVEVLEEIVEDKSELPESLLERIVEMGYTNMTNLIAIYPFDDPEAAEKFVNGIMSKETEGQEIISDHLSELKYKRPELYHPIWDQITIF